MKYRASMGREELKYCSIVPSALAPGWMKQLLIYFSREELKEVV